jgi:glutaredoxin
MSPKSGPLMVWNWLRFWARTRAKRSQHVVLYTRRGCHLCDDAWKLLEDARLRHGFTLETFDVDSNHDLTERYGMEVPVVTVDGVVRFRGRVNAVLLRRLFR